MSDEHKVVAPPVTEQITLAVPVVAKPTGKVRKYVRLTPEIKAEAQVLWKAGNMSLPELALRYGVKQSTLAAFLRSVGAKKGVASKELAAKRAAVIDEALTLDPLIHARRVLDTKNETYRITEMLRKLIAKEIVDCKQAGHKLGTIFNEIKTIKEAAAAIKICREESFAVLGIRPDDQGDEQLPELTVTDLTQDDITDLQMMPSEEDMGDVIGIDPDGPGDDNDEVSEGDDQ